MHLFIAELIPPQATNKENLPSSRAGEELDDADLERKFWANISLRPPLYGADVPGSLCDTNCKVRQVPYNFIAFVTICVLVLVVWARHAECMVVHVTMRSMTVHLHLCTTFS